MKDLIALEGVGVCYKEGAFFTPQSTNWVLDNVSFSVKPGETLGIVGRNGAGKSTLLRLLADIIRPDRGVVTRRGGVTCSLLTLQLGFNSFLSGRENAINGGMLLGASREHMESALQEIKDFSGLGNSFDMPLSSYSSGMRARLGFSVALQAEPEILLIDEALGVGDHEFRQKSSEMMREWIRSDKTVIFVSHDTSAIGSLCDRAIWLESGQVACEGEPNEILAHYYTYDKVVQGIASDMGVPELAVRKSDFGRDPLKKLNQFKLDLRGDRVLEEKKYLDNASEGVEYYVPYKRPATSLLFEEECGRVVWVEGIHEVVSGGWDLVDRYEEYQQLAGQLAARLRQDKEEFCRGKLSRDMVRLLSSG